MSEQQGTLDSTAEEITEAAEKAGLDQHGNVIEPPSPEEVEQSKPSAGELVVVDRDDVYRAMDRADEIQILDELQGRALEAMVYSFPSDGKKVTDLSYAGVRECVRTLNRERFTSINILPGVPPKVEEVTEDGQDFVQVMVYAFDAATGSGQWGIAVEPKRMKLKSQTAARYREQRKAVASDDTIWDKFAKTKALNKAQRNAMKALLPLEFTQTIVAQFLGDASKVQRLKGVADDKLAELPPPLQSEEADAVRADIRDLRLKMVAVNPLHMLPARYNILFTQVDHDLERLKEFREHMASELEKAEAASGS